jgi:dTMP kinase
MKSSAKYIVLEGLDGAGKTTQIELLKDWLIENNVDVVLTKEPSTGPIGKLARQFMQEHTSISQNTLALLFAADSLHHQDNSDGILSQLQKGKYILSDRNYLSTYAYQMPDSNIMWLDELHKFCQPPDITFFMDLDADLAMERLQLSRGNQLDVFEKLSELRRVQKQYEIAVHHFQEKGEIFEIIRIDEHTTLIEVQNKIREKITSFFNLQ